MLFTSGGDAFIRVSDLTTQKVIAQFIDTESWINRFIVYIFIFFYFFSLILDQIAGNFIYSGGGDNLVKVWGLETDQNQAEDPVFDYQNYFGPIFRYKKSLFLSWEKLYAVLKNGQ